MEAGHQVGGTYSHPGEITDTTAVGVRNGPVVDIFYRQSHRIC